MELPDGWMDVTDEEAALLAKVRETHPGATLSRCDEYGTWFVEGADGAFLCCVPGAAELRAEGRRCCAGGPCFAPAFGPTAAEALQRVIDAQTGGR